MPEVAIPASQDHVDLRDDLRQALPIVSAGVWLEAFLELLLALGPDKTPDFPALAGVRSQRQIELKLL
jgi:hypothetical protein